MKHLTTNQIRQTWLDFFSSKNHLLLPSKSLIPINDTSLLWINSGVATLKKYFSGIENPPSPRLTNCQKAIRTNDILNVGTTSRHHTFFEMLGNFSIGDYFKKEAIVFAYELLVNKYGMDIHKLYFTVYEKDNETYQNWLDLGIDKTHIIKCNKERNFWDIGQGPCGPCTEIYYDRGEKYDFDKMGIKLFNDDIENDRYVEIWNIVFSQFNNDGNGNYTELARKNIDTGAGLERLASISQDVPTDFDTDTFLPLIRVLESKSQFKYDINAYFVRNLEQMQINHDFKVIVDHIKANIFAIADGALPSNKERGSVLRKLIRRALVCCRRLKIVNFIEPLVDEIININKYYYPYLVEQKKTILEILKKEIISFSQTLEHGYELFKEIVKHKDFGTESIFKLVDTYGLPFEVINELASEYKISINEEAYLERLEQHRDISRANLENHAMDKQNNELVTFNLKSEFDYESLTIKNAKVIACFNKKFILTNALKDEGWIVFDKTSFYATSGGQQHDIGIIRINGHNLDILNVIKAPNGQHLHLVKTNFLIKVGDKVDLFVNDKNRISLSRNHSVEHLIQHALQTIVSKTIKQEGAFKSAEKVSFDFQYPSKLTDKQLEEVENQINEYIKLAINIKTHHMTLDEAKKFGAIAWFDDVYAKIKGKLRVVQMGDISTEICGGTHVTNTAQIESFILVKLSNKGAGSWRLEGITGKDNIGVYIENQIIKFQIEINKLVETLSKYKVRSLEFSKLIDEIDYRIDIKNWKHIKLLYVQIKNLYDKLMISVHKQSSLSLINEIKSLPSISTKSDNYVIIQSHGVGNKIVSQAISELANNDKQHGYIIIDQILHKLQYFVSVSKELSLQKHLSANDVVKRINEVSNGQGGGLNTFAQGGTNNLGKIIDILELLTQEF